MPYPRLTPGIIESRCKIGSKGNSHPGCPDKAQFLTAFARLMLAFIEYKPNSCYFTCLVHDVPFP
jgi:hypothetical protein